MVVPFRQHDSYGMRRASKILSSKLSSASLGEIVVFNIAVPLFPMVAQKATKRTSTPGTPTPEFFTKRVAVPFSPHAARFHDC